jgi:predicted nucleic acid-binding protein
MTRSALDVVCDAGPLIHLDELGCLDLLADFQAVFVPEQVWREVELHRPGALKRSGVPLLQAPVVLSESDPLQALVRALALDLGEQAALSLMAIHPN